MPSAFPRIGEMKHSSDGMFGLKTIPCRLFSAPPQNLASGIMPTWKSVPLEAL